MSDNREILESSLGAHTSGRSLMIFEDAHLLVVNKPPGINTHSPNPWAGEGVYEWLRHREGHWSDLAIIHRLDKDTSGVLVFGKTSLANRSLTRQFEDHQVEKRYLLVTDRPLNIERLTTKSVLDRRGDRYVSRAGRVGEPVAETRFEVLKREAGQVWIEARPITGRTHQIRVHAAANGFPVLGDTLYGGTPATRVYLHSRELRLSHPETQSPMAFTAPVDFKVEKRQWLRDAFVETGATDAYRLVHGASDGWPGLYVERLGEFLLAHSERELDVAQRDLLRELRRTSGCLGVYRKKLARQVRGKGKAETSPEWVEGDAAPERFEARENGLRYWLSFREGGSVGLFLDQRENRRRLLSGHLAAGFDLRRESDAPDVPMQVLNTFAYTCSFSVAAARAGARTTNIDLSKKYLEWGRHNMALNGLDASAHEFLHGDVFGWVRRLANRGRRFDVVILDPPTFSQSDESGVFRAEKDYAKLVSAVVPVLESGGVVLASTNAANLDPEAFLEVIRNAICSAGRAVSKEHYVPQPPDFPITKEEPAYLKTVWLRVEGE